MHCRRKFVAVVAARERINLHTLCDRIHLTFERCGQIGEIAFVRRSVKDQPDNKECHCIDAERQEVSVPRKDTELERQPIKNRKYRQCGKRNEDRTAVHIPLFVTAPKPIGCWNAADNERGIEEEPHKIHAV